MVRTERADHILTVIIDRPDRRNAVDRETAQQLADAFRAFEEDDELHVAVLYGEGGNFCAGADLKAFAEGNPNRLAEDGDGPMGPTRMVLTKPVIAAISGYAVAGGLELACWCDLRVVEETATFGVFCRRFGVPLIDGGTFRLARLIGQSRAMDLILTGRAVHSDEALQIGLANRVVPEGHAKTSALALAREIAAFPQTCLKGDRMSLLTQWGLSEEDALRAEFERGVLALDEAAQGAKAFSKGEGRHGEF